MTGRKIEQVEFFRDPDLLVVKEVVNRWLASNGPEIRVLQRDIKHCPEALSDSGDETGIWLVAIWIEETVFRSES